MDAPRTIRVVLSTIIVQEAQVGEFTLTVEVGKIFAVLSIKYRTEIVAGGYIINMVMDIHKIGTVHVTFSMEITWAFLWSRNTVLPNKIKIIDLGMINTSRNSRNISMDRKISVEISTEIGNTIT